MSSSDRDTAVRRRSRRCRSGCTPRLPARRPPELAALAGLGARRSRRRARRARPTRAARRHAGRARARPARTSCARSARSSPARRSARPPRGELLIDRVLERGHGHPLLVAILLAELGRRAGLPVGIVAGERGHFVAHQRLTQPLVLDPAHRPARRRRRARHAALALRPPGRGRAARRCCSRATSATATSTRALHVARMRTTLPFEDTAEAEQRLRRVTARLN